MVSIVIRVHNAEGLLPGLLQSIQKQTFKDWEIVAVLHQCVDQSKRLLKEVGANIVHYPTGEPFNYSRALNLGASAAQGSLFLNLSSHVEIVREDTVEKMVAAIQDHSLAGVTVPRRFLSERFSKKEKLSFIDASTFTGVGGLANFCGMIPGSLWEKHPFPEAIPTVEDTAWAAYWIHRGHRTAWLTGHAVIYKNPRYSVAKLVKERSIIALFLLHGGPSENFQHLADRTKKSGLRFLRTSPFRLRRPIWVELVTAWKLRRLSRSPAKQAALRQQFLKDNPGLEEYLKNHQSALGETARGEEMITSQVFIE